MLTNTSLKLIQKYKLEKKGFKTNEAVQEEVNHHIKADNKIKIFKYKNKCKL